MPKSFGENLVKYRKRCELTQGQLAQMLNVSPQAVSKWENGGMPDSELLPDISNILGVSIDALFGISVQTEEPDIEQLISNRLHGTPENERADIVMNLMYSIIGAYSDYKRSKIRYPEDLELETYAEIITDHEIALARLNDDLKYCCFMKIGENGLYPYIGDPNRLVNLFETLAAPDAIKLLCYLGSCTRNRMQSLSFISRNTGISLERTTNIMERLDRLGIVWRIAIDDKSDDTDKAEIVYGYVNSSPLTLILTLASSLTSYISHHDCNINTWSIGPFHMPNVNISKPVVEAGPWEELKEKEKENNKLNK